MLTVDETFVKRLTGPFVFGQGNPVPEMTFTPPREWHDEKLNRFLTNLKAQLEQKTVSDSGSVDE